MPKNILMIGGAGLVGSRLKELLSSEYNITSVSSATGVDITNEETLSPLYDLDPGSVILHLAAKADVDSCEKDKPLGEEGDAWKINVCGAENVARVSTKAGMKMLHISTDFVFDGESTPQGGYSEEDQPNPINWYAMTKYEGEKRVLKASPENVIMRIAYPYRAVFETKLDFVRAIFSRLRMGQEVKAVTDHYMTPTFIDDIARAVDAIIKQKTEGIIHTVGSLSLTPFDATMTIANVFSIENPQITKVTRAEFFKGRAPRPFNLTMKNDRIRQLGVRMNTFEEGLRQMQLQMSRVT